MRTTIRTTLIRLAAAATLAAPAALAAQTQVTGAGATFPYPMYSKWFDEYRKLHPDVQINYQSIGSGGGIQALQNQTVDFAGSDAIMNDAQRTAAKGGAVLHINPISAGVRS